MRLEIDIARDRRKDAQMMGGGWEEISTTKRVPAGFSQSTAVVVPVEVVLDVGSAQAVLDALVASLRS